MVIQDREPFVVQNAESQVWFRCPKCAIVEKHGLVMDLWGIDLNIVSYVNTQVWRTCKKGYVSVGQMQLMDYKTINQHIVITVNCHK